MNLSGSLIAVVILLVANGFFVAAEFALVKARSFRIEALANSGSSAAKLTVRIQSHLEAYLAACQLGITMASLGLGWVGEPAVAALLEPMFHWAGVPDAILHTTAFITGFLIFSSLHIVIGEQVPKTFAIRKAEVVSVWISYPLHFTYMLVYPLNWILNWSSGSLLALFGVEEATHAEVFSSDEFKGMVATSQEHGALEYDKANMLNNLFEFDQRHIGRVMIPVNSVDLLDITDPEEENLRKIRDGGHSRFPVVDGGRDNEIVGLLLTNDLYSAMLDGEEKPWSDLRRFCRQPVVVPESQRVSTLFEDMRSNRAHMAFVIDEYGKFLGIITLEDLLEEIVGEIEDETDAEESTMPITLLQEGKWQADGLASLGDIEKVVGLLVPTEEEANSLSGLLMNQLERMPAPGDIVLIDNFRLTIQDIEDLRVGQVIIERLPDDGETLELTENE
ncbi:MAG: hemolysin family protein [Gammaproteobacteria bacterium]|nr:hemolysin family protein [Gammaproteobacteria bacterium]